MRFVNHVHDDVIESLCVWLYVCVRACARVLTGGKLASQPSLLAVLPAPHVLRPLRLAFVRDCLLPTMIWGRYSPADGLADLR